MSTDEFDLTITAAAGSVHVVEAEADIHDKDTCHHSCSSSLPLQTGSIVDELYAPSPPPRLPLKSYGGALATITECTEQPQLDYDDDGDEAYSDDDSSTSSTSSFDDDSCSSSSCSSESSSTSTSSDDESSSSSNDGNIRTNLLLLDQLQYQIQHHASIIPGQDSKGRCLHHPYIQLRKKKRWPNTGWRVLKMECQDCVIEELLLTRRDSRERDREQETGNVNGLKEEEDTQDYSDDEDEYSESSDSDSNDDGENSSTSYSARNTKAASCSTLQNEEQEENEEEDYADDGNDETASLTLFSSLGSFSDDNTAIPPPPSQTEHKHDDDNNEEEHHQDKDQTSTTTTTATVHISLMDCTDGIGLHGQYSGMVNAGFKPHGLGCMMYDDGTRMEGIWMNGLWSHSH